MIIHIAGSSGSGKTTLGNELKKLNKFIVVDTDDIDDKNFKRLLKSNKEFKKSLNNNTSKWERIKEDENLKSLECVIDKATKQNNNLIIVGISLFGKADPSKFAEKKYFIKIDPDILYRRVFLRTLDDIYKNYSKIKSLLKNEENLDTIPFKLSHNFDLRKPFVQEFDFFKKREKQFIKRFRDNKYKIKEVDEIYEEIIKL